jgi:multimeric flavodoxin WrbA
MNAKTNILCIAGSHRKGGHSEFLAKVATEAAKKVDGVEAEFINLLEKKVKRCLVCVDKEGRSGCKIYDLDSLSKCPLKDDVGQIIKKCAEADGIIIVSPVYFGNVSGLLKDFMDRTSGLKVRKYWLRDKVGGALAVAAHRNGGQELTVLAIEAFFRIHGMIIVTDGAPTEEEYQEISNITYECPSSNRVSIAWGRSHFAGAFADPHYGAIEKDELGIAIAKGLGRRVAEVAKWIKNARPPFERKTYLFDTEKSKKKRRRVLSV